MELNDPEEDPNVLRARLRAGNREAFAALYDRYVPAVYNHALRLTGDWSAAEEVVSDTFLSAWRTRERLEPEGGSVKPWLLGIATHKAHNVNRGLRRRLAFLSRRSSAQPVDDFADAIAARIDDERRLAAVHAALSRLRRQDREVLALCVGEGLDHRQAAEALGVPPGTVRSRLSRARARLRALTEHPGELADDPPPQHPRRRGEIKGETTFPLPLRLIEDHQ